MTAWFIVIPEVFAGYLRRPVEFLDYLRLAWLVASLATIGGALGSGLESSNTVRSATWDPATATTIGTGPGSTSVRAVPAPVPGTPPRARSRRGGISARVIDCYSVKPVDSETSTSAARATVHGHPPSV
jgi:hypothetical protein